MTTFGSYNKNNRDHLYHYTIFFFGQQCNGIRDRSKAVELWSGVAQYCLLVGNYNSATVILESLESPAIARLQTTVSQILIHILLKQNIPLNIIIISIGTLIRCLYLAVFDYTALYLTQGKHTRYDPLLDGSTVEICLPSPQSHSYVRNV